MIRSVRAFAHAAVAMRTLMVLAAVLVSAIPAIGRQYLWQTNASGDDIHVIDIEARKVVRRIVVGPEPHGIAAPVDGSIVFVSLEANGRPAGELLWINPRTFEIVHRLPVGPEPHNLAATPDGRWIYLPCRDGSYWVVDAVEKKVIATIRTEGRPHNTTASGDSRSMYLSPMGDPHGVTVVDLAAGHRVAGTIPFSDSVRPPALSADGTRFFQHVDRLNGFEVADVASRKPLARVEHRTPLGWFLFAGKLGWLDFSGLHRCHGLAIRPDQTEIWSVCGPRVNIHGLTDNTFPELASIPLPNDGYWLTFTPDSRYAFVALPSENAVTMIDTGSRAPVAQFAVGKRPARNLVLSLPGE